MFTYEEAFKQSLEYFNGDEMAANVFLGKYALKDEKGNILEPTPDHMHKRLAKEFARVEAKYPNPMSEEEIYELMQGFKYVVPQGSPMSGIGNKYQVQSLGNCFVLEPPLDSYGSICKVDQQMAQLSKRRAGVGIDISNLRPAGAPTKNAAKSSTGIIPFMERYSNTIREVGQHSRRGALLISLDVKHYEAEEFIKSKLDETKITGANISLKLSDAFMEAVVNDSDWTMQWPIDSLEPKMTKTTKARYLWNLISETAHRSGDPGLFFWDTAQKYSPADCYKVINKDFENKTSNPCGEIIMGVDSCRLILINTLSYVKDKFTKQAEFDWEKFKDHAMKMQRLMDDLIDLEIEALDRIIDKIKADPEPDEDKAIELNTWLRFKQNCILGRRTGSGLTAIGDTLAALGLVYGTDEAIKTTEKIYKVLALSCYESSILLAKERGTFPLFSREVEKNNNFLKRIWNADSSLYGLYKQHGRRNIACLTTAPAGSVSILTQTTSGIEPVFRLSYTRRKKINPSDKETRVDFVDKVGDKWQEFKVFHHGLKQWMDINGKTEKDIQESPYWKAESNDIDWISSVDMQAAGQKWIDHSISKTINLPEDTKQEDVKKVYMRAWETGCKGITVYREGSKSGVLVSSDKKQKQEELLSFKEHHAPKRPKELSCDIYHSTVQGEKWTIFVGLLDDKPYEVMGGLSKYVNIPKRVKSGKIVKHNGEIHPARYDLHYDFESGDPDDETIIQDLGNVFENPLNSAFSRTVSLALRHGTPCQYVVEQLIKGSDKESDMFSFSKVVSRVLKNYVKDGTRATQKKCPECGGTELAFQEGCVKCMNQSCSYSRCG